MKFIDSAWLTLKLFASSEVFYMEQPGRLRVTAPCLADDQHPPCTRAIGGTMRGVLLWLVGIPIPIIILLYLFGVM
jgi:hypothetical protein